MQINDAQAALIGAKIAELLNLRPMRDFDPVRYHTGWGSKTATGLGHTVARIVTEQMEGTKNGKAQF